MGHLNFCFSLSTKFSLPVHFKLAGVSIVPFLEAFGAPIPIPTMVLFLVKSFIDLYS